jgi:hypothetical protein
MVIWGQTKEKNKIPMVRGDDLDISDEPGSSAYQTGPLLSSRNESDC